jgi:hypothetical protein
MPRPTSLSSLLVPQIAHTIGSVGDDKKLDFLMKDLGFHGRT